MTFIMPHHHIMKNISPALIIELISALFILLFVYTGISKIQERALFQIIIAKSPLIGSWATLLSWILPITELLTALLLFLPMTRNRGLVISLVLMVLFTTYIAYILLFSSRLPCSCGGVLKHLSWTNHLVFNLFFVLLGVYGLWLYKKHQLFIAINRNSRTPV